MSGYEALRNQAARLDLSARGRIRVTGEDRARLLHAMTSNHVEQLVPGRGCYAFFLNAQGRILADVNILCLEGAFLLDTEPEARQFVYEHLDRHTIADDVALEDVTTATACLGLEGPRAAEVLAAAGAPTPAEPFSHTSWGSITVAHLSATGRPGFRLILPIQEKESFEKLLADAGAPLASAGEARIVRLENGLPRYGEDLGDRYLPHEAQVLNAVHFSKGCYLGQEIVERVRARGGVHRFLMRLAIDAAEPPAPGSKVLAGGKEAGEITSAAYSPAQGRVVALAYLRLDGVAAGAPLEVSGARAEIVARQPAQP
jgi:tRNA-modifying protein YgfZ